ncbi:hypothetical protein SPHINGO391_290007 [Sphingomonas aurantiaca]|uniref:Uncharacterized protein n=1 Tax=Sphingomonas aurantiaca TaxID=185949 RepID=A0A5E7Y2B1_9SPHN|nr:hypothetical protein SPHINGO391_290007 [Sphingomonas aurantiaca]
MFRDSRRDCPGIRFVDRCNFNPLERCGKNRTTSVSSRLLRRLCLFVQMSKFRF